MGTFDRSKYKKSDSSELQAVSEEIKSREESNRGDFLKVEPGINVFRIFPSPAKSKSSLFIFPNVTSFLPFMVDEYDKVKREKTGNKVMKRKPIFNAKVHGGFSNDIVEEYIEAVKERYTETLKEKKDLLAKIKPLTDWKKGIKPSTAWVTYAYKLLAGKKTYGRLQITDGVKKQMDTLSLRQGGDGKPIVVDLFSDPDTGKKLQWTSDPTNEDLKSRNKVTIITEDDCLLEDEELEMLEGWDTLEGLYKNSYTKSDFKKQLEGLQLFDSENDYRVFDSPSFQNKIDKCKEEIESVLGSLDEEDDESENETSTEKNNSSVKKDDSLPEILEDMNKKELVSLVKSLELTDAIEIKTTSTPSKIRTSIKDALIEGYELSGSSDEVNKAITDIIKGAIEDSEDTPENETQEEETQEEETQEEETSQEETQEEEPKGKKASSLLNKYKK